MPDYRGVLISEVMYFGLELMDIMNYRCGGRGGVIWQPYWVANKIYLVVRVLESSLSN